MDTYAPLAPASVHNRTRLLCRVPQALGKTPNTHNELFVECHTRQRSFSEAGVGKDLFVEYFLSGI